MLESLLGIENEATKKLTSDEVTELVRSEKKCTKQISIDLFRALAAKNMQRTFWDKSVLKNNKNEPQYEVTMIVVIRNLKEAEIESRPIYLKMSFQNAQMWKDVNYIPEEQLTGKKEETSKKIKGDKTATENKTKDHRRREN